MRDLLVTLIVFSAVPFVLARPWLGILLWSWLGYMNPHRLSWGFAYDFPFAQVAAIATLLGFLFTRDRRALPINATTVVWLTFLIWMTLTTLAALDPAEAWPGWDKAMKIQLFIVLTMLLIRSRERLIALVWVVALSLGFYGLKGGLYVFRSGAEWQVWGPPGTFIQDNNALALAIIMTMPLLWFLMRQYQQRLIRWGLMVTMLLCCASVLGSHSRGAALAGGAMLGMLWLKSSGKILAGLAAAVVLPILVLSMPDKWFDRMGTVATYEQDRSAMGRVRAWEFSVDMALQRPTGGGFGSFTESNYRRFAPDIAQQVDTIGGGRFQEAHSIYFKVLGEHGFVGLALFMLLGILSYIGAGRVIRQARDSPHLFWARDLAAMLQVSILGFAIGGAFLGLSYFDLYYHLLSMIVVLRVMVTENPAAADTVLSSTPHDALPDAGPRAAGM